MNSPVDISEKAVARLAIAMQLNGRNDVHDMLLALLAAKGSPAGAGTKSATCKHGNGPDCKECYAEQHPSGEPEVKPLTLGKLVMDTARGIRPSGPLTDHERREVQASINAGFEKYYKGPFQFRPPVDENGAPYIYDAAGNVVAMLMWPGHPPAETEAAEQATYALGNAMAAACSVPEPSEKLHTQADVEALIAIALGGYQSHIAQKLRAAMNHELPRTHKGFRCQYEQDAVMRALDKAIAAITQHNDDGPGEEDGPWAEGWEKRRSSGEPSETPMLVPVGYQYKFKSIWPPHDDVWVEEPRYNGSNDPLASRQIYCLADSSSTQETTHGN